MVIRSSILPTLIDGHVSIDVDVLLYDQCDVVHPEIIHPASYLKSKAYCILPSDEEGGFAIFPREIYMVKACGALSSVFHCNHNVSLNKLKSEVEKLCEKVHL